MLKALRGMSDILPVDVGVWHYIEQEARELFNLYNYQEIRTPILEEASLFVRSIGEVTDIVEKQMYVFTDRGGRNIALRPEGTAAIVRAYLENYGGRLEPHAKFFYMGPMFRSERPQKGRKRQFHQLGVEAIGSDNPLLDVEVITLAVKLLKEIGILNAALKINSLGCSKDKLNLIEKYKKAAKPYLASLCDECNNRYNKNVLRIFDCKNPDCNKVVKKIEVDNILCENCHVHFETVKNILEETEIKYEIDPLIVRGLDYYTKTVFEIVQKDLGAKDAICAGGRYNNLIKDMGGRQTPAIGFAFGIERLVLAIEEGFSKKAEYVDAFMAIADKGLYEKAFGLMSFLRDRGFKCDLDYEIKSLKAQMRKAQKLGARFVFILGEDEFKKGKIVIRDMNSRSQEEVAFDKDIISGMLESKITRILQ